MQHSSKARTTIAMVRAAGVYVGVVLGLLMASDSLSLGGTFVALGPKTFVRATGQPVTVTTPFAIASPIQSMP